MHGVRRGSTEAAQASEVSERIMLLASQARKALEYRSRNDFSDEAQSCICRALEVNPDEYSLWNIRKAFLKNKCETYKSVSLESAASGHGQESTTTENTVSPVSISSLETLWDQELQLTQTALFVNPKAYPAWEHRLWLLRSSRDLVSQTYFQVLMQKERKLCDIMLQKDERNFHAWAHRLTVRSLHKQYSQKDTEIEPQKSSESILNSEEFRFITERILSNFANYSAWHQRSLLLTQASRELGIEERCALVIRELEWLHQAYFTDPDVESTWIYHRWILYGELQDGITDETREHILITELGSIQDLLAMEPNSTNALLANVRLFLSVTI